MKVINKCRNIPYTYSNKSSNIPPLVLVVVLSPQHTKVLYLFKNIVCTSSSSLSLSLPSFSLHSLFQSYSPHFVLPRFKLLTLHKCLCAFDFSKLHPYLQFIAACFKDYFRECNDGTCSLLCVNLFVEYTYCYIFVYV